jgi:hypothetical protein
VLVGTALYPDDFVGSVESYEELRGLSEDDAISATLKDFPHVPKGKDGIRSLLAYQAAHLHQLQL